ncbi:hypothetical protein H072_7822 [Dactylellina haptotyla CBS 200.50]|uniref:Uncharacterized protein n=1 Tax=Dactylellina haptotyla (strain CBS 200.50) TaxID=1284197 RepID=S8BT88_DACHA|nr:hypothetical protein H072_7822 [Dactylellina haptotyla CBS 200.50]
MASNTYSPRRADASITSALRAATVSPGSTRGRRPALIPASAFNALESTADLSSILPDMHGLQNGAVYILPPGPPPAELALKLKLEAQQLQPRARSLRRGASNTSLASQNSELDTEGDWTMSGADTPVQTSSGAGSGLPVTGGMSTAIRRWSMKELVNPELRNDEEPFDTPKQYLHKRQTSTVSDDLFSWVNSSTDAETGTRMVDIDHRLVKDLDSLPTSPMSSVSQPDITRQLDRLREASRLLHEL